MIQKWPRSPLLQIFCPLMVGLLIVFGTALYAAESVPERLFVDGPSGDDNSAGDKERPFRSLSAAIARLPEPLPRSVTIEWTAANEAGTGGREMSSTSLELMRRMRPGVKVSIIGQTNRSGELPKMAWEGGAAMVDVREGDWWLENVQIGTGTTRQRRGVMVTGSSSVTLKNVIFRTRSLSDAAIYAQRGGLVELRGDIRINEHLHDRAEEETFGGIIATDHGNVRFVERERASLEIGNGSLSASYYGIIRLGCETARITSWGEQSNCLAVNNSGRIDLHNTTTRLSARQRRNTPIGLEHDGHVLAEGARILIEGTNNTAIHLQKASTLTCNEIEFRGQFPEALIASSGSMFVGRFKTAVAGLSATTSATINVEAAEGNISGPLTATSGGVISLPGGKVVTGK
jgi:hypothetical protein